VSTILLRYVSHSSIVADPRYTVFCLISTYLVRFAGLHWRRLSSSCEPWGSGVFDENWASACRPQQSRPILFDAFPRIL